MGGGENLPQLDHLLVSLDYLDHILDYFTFTWTNLLPDLYFAGSSLWSGDNEGHMQAHQWAQNLGEKSEF